MGSDGAVVPRRLSDLLTYTQRFRISLAGLALLWYTVIMLLGLDIETGPGGRVLLGAVVVAEMAMALVTPRVVRYMARQGQPIDRIHTLLLVVDTAMCCACIPLTGGKISIVFALFYVMAIGNCYMFTGRRSTLANAFMGACYVGTLLVMVWQGDPYAPTLMDWVDILLVRVPLIFVVSGYARWLARRGDRLVADDQDQYHKTLQGLLAALEARDGYTLHHSLNVAEWSAAFALWQGATEEEAMVYRHAAELHDIGKIGIPDAVLNKPGKLLPDEYARMKEHPLIGVRITEHVKSFSAVHLAIIRSHHERWDGKGYPDGLAKTAIPYEARLSALCDVYDALTNDRPYRSGMAMSMANQLMWAGRGTQFDPDLTDAFARFLHDMVNVISEQFDVVECWAANWAEDGLRIRVQTGAGSVMAHLTLSKGRWHWIGCEPVAESGAGPLAAGAYD